MKNAINFDMIHKVCITDLFFEVLKGIHNFTSIIFVFQFLEVFSTLQFDKSARVLILRSNVPGIFCVGKLSHSYPFRK